MHFRSYVLTDLANATAIPILATLFVISCFP